MTHLEKLERRLRILSFVFVFVAFVFVCAGIVLAARAPFAPIAFETAQKLPTSDAIGLLVALITVERSINRLLFLALFILQLGLLFILYLIFVKLERLIRYETGGD